MREIYFVLWGGLLAAYAGYSYKFLYRSILDRPEGFYGARRMLFFLHFLALALLVWFLLSVEDVASALVVIIIAGTVNFSVKNAAYRREVEKVGNNIYQGMVERGNLTVSREAVFDTAKSMVDRQIADGRRSR